MATSIVKGVRIVMSMKIILSPKEVLNELFSYMNVNYSALEEKTEGTIQFFLVMNQFQSAVLKSFQRSYSFPSIP